ncbi:collagen alpha-6(VI) chain-like [Tiliqua scincoides]|uniref:collagen alpha-6(VI) chain-like n=1 Tax=Tiliqua scincoides TaxID=71010 RepID=UPI0034634245
MGMCAEEEEEEDNDEGQPAREMGCSTQQNRTTILPIDPLFLNLPEWPPVSIEETRDLISQLKVDPCLGTSVHNLKMFLTLLLLVLGTQISLTQKPASESTDVVLLIDSSNALGKKTFSTVKAFVNRMISGLPVGPNKYRLAVVQYSDDVHIEFPLDEYRTKNHMLNHLKKQFSFRGGSLRTGNAIQKVHEMFFKTPRKDRNQIVVVATSGVSEDDVERPAQSLQDDGVKIIALGIQAASPQELQRVATPPFYHVFETPKELVIFSQNMSEVIEAAIQMDSSVVFSTTVPPSVTQSPHNESIKVCPGDSVADVAFVVDQGVSRENANYITDFLQNAVQSLEVHRECIRIALVAYSTEPQIISFLNTSTDKTEILQEIQSFSPRKGKSNLGAAIDYTRKRIFVERTGSRKSQAVDQVATIITHRPSDDNISEAATLLRRTGVTVFAMGLEGANDTQLTQIVSYPPKRNVIKLVRFSDLPSQNETFQKKLFSQIQNKLYVQSERRKQLRTGCGGTEKADIYFLIDGSSSIHSQDFTDMKNFMMGVAKLFTVGSDDVRFGVVQYSNSSVLEFKLDYHANIAKLNKAINNIKQLNGDTYTGAALEALPPLFKEARKQRSSQVPCHLIVLTDGEAHDNVKIPAEILRRAEVNMYAIGVREANKTQLLEIAGSESRVYFVQQFDSLKDIKDAVVRDICSEEACKEMKADIMFLVDSSTSIQPEDFQKMKIFMKELVNKSDIGLDQVRVGVVQFSDKNKEEFRLDKHSKQHDIIEAIGSISPITGNTHTGGALQFVSDYFTPAKGARPHVKKILILITDGEAQDEVKTPAEALRNAGIIIYAVGVFNASKQQLEEISGKPEMVFYVENFDILKQIENDIIFGVCSPPEECRKMNLLDVVFVIDSSGSIGDPNYGLMKNFMIDLVNKSDVGKDNVQFGALKYSDDPQILFYLNDYSTKSDIIEAIQNDTLLGHTTYTAKALKQSEALFAEQHGSRIRRDVPQILIVITDGESHDKAKLDEVSKRLRSRNVIIYAVGIQGAKKEELLTMAGSDEKWFYVDAFKGLENVSVSLSNEMCNSSKPGCNIHGEIIFLIDGSKSTANYFEDMKSFFKELLDRMVFNSNIRIGMAQFSDGYQEEFQLGDHQNKAELKDKIDRVSVMKGRKTCIGEALKRVKSFFKSPKQRVVRDVTKQMLLVFTDGKSYDDVAQPAEDLRKEGVEIYTIGAGKVNHEKLVRITGSSDRKYTIANFSLTSDIQKNLITQMCAPDSQATCFVDVVLGFDISSQKTGDHLFHGHPQLEAKLPDILKKLTSDSTVSCNRGTNTQFSVAIPMESSNLQVDHEKILEKLSKIIINKPSHLDARFLDTLWNSFQKLSDTQKRSKVLLLFSDGLDDDVTVLEKKSEEFRKQGLDGLITVALKENKLDNLTFFEFGKGFGYKNQDTIYTPNLARRLLGYMDRIAERACCCVTCKCTGEEGPIGNQGIMGTKGSTGIDGSRGHFGEEGVPGPPGDRGSQGMQGYKGCQGIPGQKGVRGVTGEKGELGSDGVDGINGEEGSRGLPGLKGEKGNPGQPGSSGPRGVPGDHGQKGFQGDPGNPGVDNGIPGERGPRGSQGSKGERGSKGSAGLAGSQGNTGAEGRRGPPGPPGQKGILGPDGLQGEQGFHGPPGTTGIPGLKGEKGHSGNEGPEGNVGVAGPKGNQGKPGARGNNGEPGDPGEKGRRGPRGQRGPRGEEGAAGYGRPGIKGSKGQEGFLGYIGMQGEAGDPGLRGEPGRKGNQGRMGLAGKPGGKGVPGDRGYPGHPGAKGAKGLSSFSPCEVIEYVRRHSPCWKGTQGCPVYPTDLVFALDASQDVTPQIFEQMREIIIAIVNDTKIRESTCPVGARVAVVSYNSATHHLIRFSDFHTKNRMLQELKALSYQRSTDRRDIGGSMKFIARNIFKRTLQSPNVRKIAVFFSNGQSSNSVSINTAVLEFSALDILPVVIAFNRIPEVNRAFEMDDSGLFQVINIQQGRDYIIPRLNCILCYDKCQPNESCLRVETSSPQTYMDAAFILENSRKTSPVEFEKLKDFLSATLDSFDISSDPESSLIGDRLAVVSHAPPEFGFRTQKSPVRTEFEFLNYTSRGQMKRHIQESVQQMSGAAAVGHAIQWAVNNLFSEVPNQRKYKAIFVISAGETSQWDKEVLRDAALRAKCQGFVVFVLSLGHEFNDLELEELASLPLEHHLIQLGRVHKADLSYAVKFLKSFLHLIRRGINRYPPGQLRRRCAEITAQSPVYVPQHQIRTFAVDEFVSSGARPVETDSNFTDLLGANSELLENFRT